LCCRLFLISVILKKYGRIYQQRIRCSILSSAKLFSQDFLKLAKHESFGKIKICFFLQSLKQVQRCRPECRAGLSFLPKKARFPFPRGFLIPWHRRSPSLGTGRSEACPRVWLPTKSIQMSLECCRCINFCDWFFPIFFCHYRCLSVGENASRFVFSFQFIPIQEIVFLFEIYTPAFSHPFYSLLSLCRRSRFEKSDPSFKHTRNFLIILRVIVGFP